MEPVFPTTLLIKRSSSLHIKFWCHLHCILNSQYTGSVSELLVIFLRSVYSCTNTTLFLLLWFIMCLNISKDESSFFLLFFLIIVFFSFCIKREAKSCSLKNQSTKYLCNCKKKNNYDVYYSQKAMKKGIYTQDVDMRLTQPLANLGI